MQTNRGACYSPKCTSAWDDKNHKTNTTAIISDPSHLVCPPNAH